MVQITFLRVTFFEQTISPKDDVISVDDYQLEYRDQCIGFFLSTRKYINQTLADNLQP